MHLPRLGWAAVGANLTFQYIVAITSVTPALGSAGGGTTITVSGHGFEYLPSTDLPYLTQYASATHFD